MAVRGIPDSKQNPLVSQNAGKLNPGLDFYEERYRKTLAEWTKYLQGDVPVDLSIVPVEIVESWDRCRGLGADAIAGPRHTILEGADLRNLLEQNRDFISVSRPFLLNLYQFVKGSRFVVGLFDRQGFLLDSMQDDEGVSENVRLQWVPGVQWDEAGSGNNAAGTVLALQKPIRIFGPQHYNRMFHGLTVSSAPIFNPEGELMGGITLTAYYYGTNPHTLGMAVAAAQAIGNELKAQKALNETKAAFAEMELACSVQQAVITSIPEALIAIDGDGRVLLMNEKARKKFFQDMGPVAGRVLRDIIAQDPKAKDNESAMRLVLHNDSITDAEVRIYTKGGSADYTLTCNPILSAGGKPAGKILILSEIKRIKTLVTKMIGAKANFRFKDICGRNQRFQQILEQAQVVSQSSSNVLLLGESGTGKDIFAQAIHNASQRRNGPYVAINCAAMPRDLISSELFGYSEGAFTGSRRGGSQGKFELADGGTIFLDEIAETPLEFQTALLRVIEDKRIVRIGGSQVRPVDVRIIAATNKDLLEEVHRGSFRKDLYYRLNVFTIHMLPLSQRLDDIPLLVDMFVRKYGSAMGKRISRVDERVMEVFLQYPWPGNVRELQNVIERMMNYGRSDELTVDLIPPEIIEARHARFTEREMESPEETERKLISRMLRLNFRKNQIAQKLGMSRTTLFRKMKKYGLG